MALHPEQYGTLNWSLKEHLLLGLRGRQPSGLPPKAPAFLDDWVAVSLQNLSPFMTSVVPVEREVFPIGFWFSYYM